MDIKKNKNVLFILVFSWFFIIPFNYTMEIQSNSCVNMPPSYQGIDTPIIGPHNDYKLNEYSTLEYTIYVSPDGLDSNPGTELLPFRTIQHAADIARSGDMVLVKNGTYNEYVSFKYSGNSTSPIVFIAESNVLVNVESIPWNHYWGPWEGIYDIRECSFLTIAGFNLKNSYWFGIYIYRSYNIIIDSCYAENTMSSGIHVEESDEIMINNNKVRNACMFEQQECITFSNCSNFKAIHNEIWEMQHLAHGYGGGEGLDAKVGCYSGELAYNLIHDIWMLGIYIDSYAPGTNNISVHHNIVTKCNAGIAVASEHGELVENISIYNNLVINTTVSGISVSGAGENGPKRDIKIYSNTLVNCGGGAMEEWNWATGGIEVHYDTHITGPIIIRNNIVLSNNSQWNILADISNPYITVENNLISEFRGWEGETRGTNYIEADPQFVDIKSNRFDLQASSPAIDNGTTLSAPLNDIWNVTRPQGLNIDIGAFEYNSTIPEQPLFIESPNEAGPQTVWEGPAAPYLELIFPNPDTDGIITLDWNDIPTTLQYHVYWSDSFISSINENVFRILYSYAPYSSCTFYDVEEGTHYYVVVALNLNGTSEISNCQSITVNFSSSTTEDPSSSSTTAPQDEGSSINNGLFGLYFSIFVIIYQIYSKQKKKKN